MNANESKRNSSVVWWSCWVALALMFVLAAITLPKALDSVTVHWGIDGTPDAQASTAFALFLIPLVSVGIQLIAIFLPRIDPGGENYQNFQASYWKVILTILIYLGGIHGLICYAAVGQEVNMATILPVMVGALLIVIGNYLGKLRPNWMIGIRTPWTLSSKRSWNKTHRLGRWVMMFIGLATGFIALSPGRTAYMVVGTVWGVCLLTLVVYSWLVWRSDPDKVPPAGVFPASDKNAPSGDSSSHMLLLFIGVVLFDSLWSTPGLCQTPAPWQALQLGTPTGVLHASLDLPPKADHRVPVVLVIPGSGPTDADGNSPGAKNDSLKQLGAALAKSGYAVCRVDKRGIGRSRAAGTEESELRFETYVSDAIAWIKHLKSDQRFSEVHLLGHSEGSLVGILAAQKIRVASFVSIAGTGVAGGTILRRQLTPKLPPETMRQVESILTELEGGREVAKIPSGLNVLFRPSVQPYLRSWFRYDPAKEVAELRDTRVLIIQGSTDIQCTVDDANRLALGLDSAKKEIIPEMNHVLKRVADKTPVGQQSQYTDPTIELHPQVAPSIQQFLSAQ